MSGTRLRFLRPFSTHVFNRFSRPFVGHLPGFAIVRHVGRTSGRSYRTPMKFFRADDDYVFALTYGADVHWVKNVLAARTCELEIMGKVVRLEDPVVFVDPARRLMPRPVRPFLGLLKVTEFMRMRPVGKGRAA